jgi:hypothetical protein
MGGKKTPLPTGEGWGKTGVYRLTGRPWDVLPKDQSPDHPPQGIWVSRKNEKSYVYDLVYTDSE